ncbi:MAG: OmpA family protein, partial [Pseudomonadota bacterium]
MLDDVVVVANEAGYASIRLDGYTDLSGSAQYNLGLSERRANSVANGLIARGIAPDEIVIRAFGDGSLASYTEARVGVDAADARARGFRAIGPSASG